MSGVGTTQSAIAVGVSFPIIDGIAVCLRFYTRRKLDTKNQLDDWLCIPAWFCLTGCCAALLAGVYKGAFTDVLSPDKERILAQVTGALTILWMSANFLIKLIMLYFYRRIFVGTIFNICNWALVGLSVLWIIYAVISWLFYCGTNFEANFEGGWSVCPLWGFQVQMGVFALDSFIDFILVILPIPFVWRLHLDIKRRIAVIVVFLLGGFAFVAGLINTIIQIINLTQPELAAASVTPLVFFNWPTIEIGVGLLASNLPHLSFRLGRAIKQSMPRALCDAIDSFRHTALSLSSGGHHNKHPYDPRSTPQAADLGEALEGKSESRQGLRPCSIVGKWSGEEGPKKSMAQGPSWSMEVVELQDMGPRRTGDDAV